MNGCDGGASVVSDDAGMAVGSVDLFASSNSTVDGLTSLTSLEGSQDAGLVRKKAKKFNLIDSDDDDDYGGENLPKEKVCDSDRRGGGGTGWCLPRAVCCLFLTFLFLYFRFRGGRWG